MSYANQYPTLFDIIQKLTNRVTKLELSPRFSVPVVTTDPTVIRNGDMWLNSTTNTLKIVDSTGAVRTINMI